MSARHAVAALLLTPPTLADAGIARAADSELTVDSAAQFYEMRSPSGETVITRRRLTTTLGVAVYDLIDRPKDGKGPELSFRARLRYDADYGGDSAETQVSNFGRLVPGFDRGPVDLMYGYVEGRRFLGGWLGFRIGRQYVTDALGWWSFDGGLVKITTPYYFATEIYGGMEQRGGMPLSLPRYERDGIWRGDRTGYDTGSWTSFQQNDVAPAYGFAIETTGLSWLHGRLTYRRVENTGSSNVAAFASSPGTSTTYDGWRVSQERVGFAMDATLANVGGAKAGLAYDMYIARMSTLFASVDAYVSKRVTVSADYDYYVPTFDADSIWNFFMPSPMNDLSVRANWDATEKLSIAGGLRGRVFMVQTAAEDSEFEPMGGGDVSVRYRWGEGQFGARGAGDFAMSSDRIGMDVYGERVLETRYVLQGRAGVWQWNDADRTSRSAVSAQYVIGAGYKLMPRSLALAEFEHDINRLSGQRFRLMFWLNLAVTK
ncbi:MAG: hypothetical protein FWD69_00515 [Polyangiaceae bacterium]|nr:hypothetical protein [Polyangiaceae bacterium]